MGDETNRVGLIPSKNLEENRKAFVRSDMDYSKSSLCEYILKQKFYKNRYLLKVNNSWFLCLLT